MGILSSPPHRGVERHELTLSARRSSIERMRITIFGCGYVGLVTGACLAQLGNDVMCIDVDRDKVARLREGCLPMHEPGLAELVACNCRVNRLSFSTDITTSIAYGEILMIAVGPPATPGGAARLDGVFDVARVIGQQICSSKTVVLKSTVPPGTADRVRALIDVEMDARTLTLRVDVLVNPEFLREGSAINDFMQPERIIIGCDDDRVALAGELLRQLYEPLAHCTPVLCMPLRAAEFTKYAANAMLAPRISFMNEQAPSRVLVCELLKHGAHLILHDPVALAEARRALDTDFADSTLPAQRRLAYTEPRWEALHDADALVITTEWPQFRTSDIAQIKRSLKSAVIFDGRNLFQPRAMSEAGIEYHGIGHGPR